MPPKIQSLTQSAPTPAAPATAVSNTPREAPRPAAPTAQTHPARTASSARDDEGVAPQEGDSTTGRASSDPYPKYDSFGPWPSGRAIYLCSVNKIVTWPFGTMVTFRVEFGPERGRTFDWGQSEPSNADADGKAKWRGRFFGAYAIGGWPLEADAETGWPGWERNRAGVPVPPYDQMFVHRAPDDVLVPVVMEVDTWTGDKGGGDKGPTPFVNAVSHWIPDGHDAPIQAPMPYHLPVWLAEVNRWQYTPDTAKGGKYGDLKVAKVDYKQIPFGHGGLKTMRDMKG